MRAQKRPVARPNNDDADDDADDAEADALDDDAALEDDADGADDDDLDDGDPETDADRPASARSPRPSRSVRARAVARGPGGMGRPSTGPTPRAAAAPGTVDVSAADAVGSDTPTELVPDISQWPGTSEAAKLVGRHTSTIKMWRAQNRIRAIQDHSGCWRYHPDDLAEAVDTPDATDPGAVLASGMTAIVGQSAAAGDRLLAMTELSVDGLKDTIVLLRSELARVYTRNAELEKTIEALRDKHAATFAASLQHERAMRRLDMRHELNLAGSKETSERLAGLLTIIAPIAASIGMRMLGNVKGADAAEASVAAGAAPAPPSAGPASPSAPTPPTPSPNAAPTGTVPPQDDRLTFEAKISDVMSRLTFSIRSLAPEAFAGLRAMLPAHIAEALSNVRLGESDATVGQALAVLVKAAQGLSDLQFIALRPIAPADIVAILSELRALFRDDADTP